MQLNW